MFLSIGNLTYAQTLDSIAPDNSGISSLTSFEFSQDMLPGWNVGNSLEAIGGETAWGNPLISQRLVDSVKAVGFKTIRIPVAWSKFIDTAAYKIDSVFMNRVDTVVNYVLKRGMYAMINLHWDGGWMQPTYGKQTYVNNRLAVMWKQIAIHFRDYGDHLLFAGTNEVMVGKDYSTPTKEYYTVQNSFNQTFVKTIRSTGGRNYYRYLVVQGFNTNIDYTDNYFTMPEDVVSKKLLLEVHYYDPYNFTLNTSSSITQWGKYAYKSANTETWANESYADAQFQKMKAKFVDNNYGVIVGEYGAMARLNLGSSSLNTSHADFRRYYIQYIFQSIAKHQLVPVYWDNGGMGDKGMGIFNRTTCEMAYPKIVKAVVDTSATIETVTVPTSMDDLQPLACMMIFPNPVMDLLTIRITDNNIKTIRICNSYGQIVKILTVCLGSNTFNVKNLSAGMYFIEVTTPAGVISKKMIKK
jgi:endoglucanase